MKPPSRTRRGTPPAAADPTVPGPGLRIEHARIGRGRRPVLEAGALRAPAGSVVALVGGNGAGKSTLLMAAAGVLLGGRAGITLHGRPAGRVAYVAQRPALPPWLTVREGAALHAADASLLADAARRLGMTELLDRRAGRLSTGQVQALAVAIALSAPPPVALLDEPFSAVDLARRPVLRQLVVERAGRVPDGATVLSSHVAADLAALCDWVVVLRDGRYAFQGTADALVGRTGTRAPSGAVAGAGRVAGEAGDGEAGDGEAGDGEAGDGEAGDGEGGRRVDGRPVDAEGLEQAVGRLLAPTAGHSAL